MFKKRLGFMAITLAVVSLTGCVRPIGVYRGPGQWGIDQMGSYQQYLGKPVEYVLDYEDIDTWSNQTWPEWQAQAWAKVPNARLVLGGTGIFPVGGSWAEAARGAYDQHYRTLGQRLVASGQEDAILRGGHEFNGDWFHYGVDQSEVGDFITAWRRWVDAMRSTPGQRFVFEWNPTVGTEALRHPDDAYPGDQWVDEIGIDVYDGWYNRGWRPGIDAAPTRAEQDAVWDQILNGERGLVFWRDFARAHQKNLAFPEWGLELWIIESDGLCHGGGDNPLFIQRMHEIISDPAWNVWWHAFWEQPGFGVGDPDAGRQIPVPQSRAMFKQLFGR